MPDAVEVRFAREAEVGLVSSLLVEAATWSAERGAPMWPLEELGVDALLPEVGAGCFVLAMAGGDAVGTARVTHEDPAIWPDAEAGVAVYVHRVAIRRGWAGRGLPGMVLAWCEG